MDNKPDHELLPGFLTPDETTVLYNELVAATPWRHDSITLFGVTHLVPRLTAWYGDEGARYSYSRLAMEPLAWTPSLAALRRRVEDAASASFNSVLVNWYRDGRDSNGWHADDEPELGHEPVIASLSLGATRFMSFKRRDGHARYRLPLTDGDLLVMRGDSQSAWLHAITKSVRVTDGRLNLTFRRVAIAHDDAGLTS